MPPGWQTSFSCRVVSPGKAAKITGMGPFMPLNVLCTKAKGPRPPIPGTKARGGSVSSGRFCSRSGLVCWPSNVPPQMAEWGAQGGYAHVVVRFFGKIIETGNQKRPALWGTSYSVTPMLRGDVLAPVKAAPTAGTLLGQAAVPYRNGCAVARVQRSLQRNVQQAVAVGKRGKLGAYFYGIHRKLVQIQLQRGHVIGNAPLHSKVLYPLTVWFVKSVTVRSMCCRVMSILSERGSVGNWCRQV